MKLPKKFGAPAKREPTPGQRVALSLRLTPDLKRRLDAAAEAGGRSQSQEAEFRLQSSFDREELLPEVMSLNYGKELAGFLMLLGTAIIFADCLHVSAQPKPIIKRTWAWAADADAYNEAVEAAVTVLETFRPMGMPTVRSGSGADMANAIIKAVRGDPDAVENPFTEDAPMIRSLLGPLVERMGDANAENHLHQLPLPTANAQNDSQAPEANKAGPPSEKKEPAVIRRYAARRLYSTETSSYVTFDDLATMVRSGRDFVVIDANTGDDITHAVLTEIAVEQESRNRGDTRRRTDPVVPAFPQANVSIVNEQHQRLVPILTLDQAIEVAAFRWAPSKWGDSNVALARSECGSRAFALEVFNSDEADTFSVGDLLILDPDERPAHGNWVLARVDHRAVLGQYRVGERDAILAMLPEERENLREKFKQLLDETGHSETDNASIAARYESLRKAYKLDVEDALLTNNLSRKHIFERRQKNLPTNICAVVMEHTKIQSVRQPEAFAELRQHHLAAKRA